MRDEHNQRVSEKKDQLIEEAGRNLKEFTTIL
jgi:hypothetical protein